jgi:hypothetical protein
MANTWRVPPAFVKESRLAFARLSNSVRPRDMIKDREPSASASAAELARKGAPHGHRGAARVHEKHRRHEAAGLRKANQSGSNGDAHIPAARPATEGLQAPSPCPLPPAPCPCPLPAHPPPFIPASAQIRCVGGASGG